MNNLFAMHISNKIDSMWFIDQYLLVLRKLPKNMILAGLWFDPQKPPMQMFLRPIVHMLQKLETTGEHEVKVVS